MATSRTVATAGPSPAESRGQRQQQQHQQESTPPLPAAFSLPPSPPATTADMANERDAAFSPSALTPSIRGVPAKQPSPMEAPAAPATTPPPLLPPSAHTVNATGDRRRTQSATELHMDMARAASPASSPRGQLPVSRSSSFLNAMAQLAKDAGNSILTPPPLPPPSPRDPVAHVVRVEYADPGPLYVDLYSRADGRGAFVKSFRRKADGTMGNAEASGHVRLNDMLYAINGTIVTDMVFAEIIQAAKSATFPCTVVFHSRLPPPSRDADAPANGSPAKTMATTTWSAKLGQMMAESGLKRSGSFEKRAGDELPSPMRRSSAAHGAAGSPTVPPPRNWGEGIKNSDGVKNLLRIMGRGRPEEDRETVEGWFEGLHLAREDAGDGRGREIASTVAIVLVTTGGRHICARDEDLQEFAVTWYRRTPEQDLIEIKGVRSGSYFPSVDDAGARLSVRCHSLRFPQLARVVEFTNAFEVDPAVKDMVDILLEAGAGSFSATLASNEYDSFQIKILTDRITLAKVSEEENEGGIVCTVEYNSHVQVLLDPIDPLRFTLKVQELGSMLGHRAGDTCDVKKSQLLAGVSCFFLVAQNPQHRDILALLIRRFRARAIPSEEENQACRDEMNLFVDPAGSLNQVVTCNSDETRTSIAAASLGNKPPVGSTNSTDQVRKRSTQNAPTVSAQLPNVKFRDMFSDINGEDIEDTRTSTFVQASPARNSYTGTSDGFIQDRLLAQGKEITMLQEKLASLSVLVKATEHEKNGFQTAIEVKDKRIESQQMRIQQVEKVNVQLVAQTRELQLLRCQLEDERKQHTTCQHQLASALATVSRHAEERVDRSCQTDKDVEIPSSYRIEFDKATSTAAKLTDEVEELQRKLRVAQADAASIREAHLVAVAERNALRCKTNELAKEVRRIVGKHRSIEDVEKQLAERSHLVTQLAIARAESKRAVDEMKEYKDALDLVVKQQNLGDKDKVATQRLATQNAELQRLVHQLTDSLNETREQMTAMKKINGALVDKLQQGDPDFRGSILESPPMSPHSVTSSIVDPRFSDSDDDDDAEDNEDEEDEGFGPPGPKSEVVTAPKRSPQKSPQTHADDSDDDYDDAVELDDAST